VDENHESPGFDSLNQVLADFEQLGDGYAPAYAYDLTVMRSFFEGWMRRNSAVMAESLLNLGELIGVRLCILLYHIILHECREVAVMFLNV